MVRQLVAQMWLGGCFGPEHDLYTEGSGPVRALESTQFEQFETSTRPSPHRAKEGRAQAPHLPDPEALPVARFADRPKGDRT